MANAEATKIPVVINPWSAEWKALGAYDKGVRKAASNWAHRRHAKVRVPRVLTPALGRRWHLEEDARTAPTEA